VSLAEEHGHVRQTFAAYAEKIVRRRRDRQGYAQELLRRLRFYIQPGAAVLEIGVGTGDLLAGLEASRAVGVDLSPEMLEIARAAHPQLELHELAAEDLSSLEGPFDYIVLSDLTVFLFDILAVVKSLRRLCHPRTRLIFSTHSRLWQPVLGLLSWLGRHHGHPRMNWVYEEDLVNMLELADFDVVKTDVSTLLPARIPLLSTLANRWLYRLPMLGNLCLVNWLVARPKLAPSEALSVSVICPCRDEAGNIDKIVARTPMMGGRTELIFVEGHSSDGTWEAIERAVAQGDPRGLALSACRQEGRGKGDAVRLGFARATGDVLMILDADMTVPPESLPTFFELLAEGRGEFINGCRLVYPMDDEAMRFLNILGNKFFARVFSYLLGQTIKDTLCGTKVLLRSDYERLAAGRAYFGEFDPFGDFDLLFGASKMNLKIVELPVRYAAREYGDTSINRFRDGLMLLRMSAFAFRRLRLI